MGRNGLCSGICINPDDGTIIVVKDLRLNRKGSYKIPGGRIEDGENPQEAMRREWDEEVGTLVEDCIFIHQIPRTGPEGVYMHYLFLVKIPKDAELKKESIPWENGPPEIKELKELELYPSHLGGLKKVLEILAVHEKKIAEMLLFLGWY